jgi:hypothetical protein
LTCLAADESESAHRGRLLQQQHLEHAFALKRIVLQCESSAPMMTTTTGEMSSPIENWDPPLATNDRAAGQVLDPRLGRRSEGRWSSGVYQRREFVRPPVLFPFWEPMMQVSTDIRAR